MLLELSPLTGTLIIAGFFFLHWFTSAFHQTFFLHRYASHAMFHMHPFWEKFFYMGTFVTQGSSFLNPRAYAVLHRMHHAHSDTEKDPHSPHFFKDVFRMMWQTKKVYEDYLYRRGDSYFQDARRFDKNYPEWPWLDRFSHRISVRLGWIVFYVAFYVVFAPSPWFFLLLPIHFLMGPIHGAAVNWCGHKYGYSNFDNGDHSKNTSPFDVMLMGELFQNNHHKYPGRAKFAVKRWEFDPVYPMMKVLQVMRIIKLKPKAEWRKTEAEIFTSDVVKSLKAQAAAAGDVHHH